MILGSVTKDFITSVVSGAGLTAEKRNQAFSIRQHAFPPF